MSTNEKFQCVETNLSKDRNLIAKLLLWCSLLVFIGMSAVSQGSVSRFIPGVLIAAVVLFYLIVVCGVFAEYNSLKKLDTQVGMYGVISAAGTIWCVSSMIYRMVKKSNAVDLLVTKGISSSIIITVLALTLMVASIIALYGLSVIYNYILENCVCLIKSFAKKNSEIEQKICILIGITFVLLVFFVYTKTTAFYNSGYNDVIYGSDSYTLANANVWLALFQNQNDLRQPLYMLTAGPFMGVAYIIGEILNCFCTNGVFIGYALVQVVILVLSIWILSCLISEYTVIRIFSMLLLSGSYPAIVFSLCLEQYVTSFFWLILTISAVVHNQKQVNLMIIGAANGLLTSAFMIVWKKGESFTQWLRSSFKCGFMFLIALFAFGRADIFINIKVNLAEIFQYTGEKLTIGEKVQQYFKFVADCFIGQPAIQKVHHSGFLIWGTSEPCTISVMGCVFFILVLIAIVWNRKSLLCKISASWIGFSIILLCILGWGTSSNALFLYALYFSWAFWVPILLSFQKIYDKGYNKSVIIILTSLLILMLRFNVMEFIRMFTFAIENYPT